MVWDGDCNFCRLWIERWRAQTAGRVDYEPSQTAATRFPEIGDFHEAVVLILPDGRVYRGAEAVFHSLTFAPRRGWLLPLYKNVPGLAPVSDAAYRFIARHRQLASGFTRVLWGKGVARPTYFVTRDIFIRALGIVYLIAFISLWTQIDGLMGERGILPAREFFSAVRAEYGSHALAALPSLCWLSASNASLHAFCAAGAIASALVVFGLAPVLTLLVCFASYLSLTIAGQTFLSFQWDILLLETGFLALFFAPWRLTLTRAAPVSSIALFLLKFLLFKLMFMSGVVKLTSHDGSWWDLTALNYHYWTQPLPTIFAWFADKDAEWFKKASVAFCLVIEIIVPFFIWAPRRLRLAAVTLLVTLQIAIALTGNYCFFNLLALALCLLLLDDNVWRRSGTQASSLCSQSRKLSGLIVPQAHFLLTLLLLIFTLPLNLWHCYSACRPESVMPGPLRAINNYVAPVQIANGYGLFRVMTKERPEIQIEGSADGIDWFAYEFRWKPGDVRGAPRWAAPHQPRLDRQMWFAALGSARQEPWFATFMFRLLEDQPSVTRLLAVNPFSMQPPRYVRAILFKYEFTSSNERRATGAWWKRREIGEYFPEVSLSDFTR